MQFSRQEDIISINVEVTLLPLTQALVREAMTAAGFGRCFIVPDQINNLLADYQILQSDLKLGKIKEHSRLERKIAQRKNAEVKFEISPDAMTATASITAAWGGTPISANDLVKAAQEYGITWGFQKDKIVHLVTNASRSEPGVVHQQIIALGRVMQPGQNAIFEPMVAGMTTLNKAPVMTSSSRSDLRDFGIIPSVKTGESIVRRIPPTAGIDGVNVRGEIELASPGVNVEWVLGEGVSICADDVDLLIADRDGMPRILEAGATVDEVYAVKKVDLSTGHIQFRGAVVVNGEVAEGMKVIAGGDVFIKGTLEGALVEAGGSVSIGGAIIGHQINLGTEEPQFSTIVKAKGDIKCLLAQYVKIECGGDFYATKQINHCHVTARMAVAGTDDKLSGKVVGGEFYLAAGLKAGVLGSPSESTLALNLNRVIDPVADKQLALRQNVAAVKREMEEIKDSIEQMKKLEKSEAAAEHIRAFAEDFEAQKAVAMALIEDIKKLETQRQDLMAEVAVIAKQQVFAGVEVLIGTEKLLLKREYGPSQIKWIDGAVKIDALLT